MFTSRAVCGGRGYATRSLTTGVVRGVVISSACNWTDPSFYAVRASDQAGSGSGCRGMIIDPRVRYRVFNSSQTECLESGWPNQCLRPPNLIHKEKFKVSQQWAAPEFIGLWRRGWGGRGEQVSASNFRPLNPESFDRCNAFRASYRPSRASRRRAPPFRGVPTYGRLDSLAAGA